MPIHSKSCFQSSRYRPAKQLQTTRAGAVFKAVENVLRSSFKQQKNAPHHGRNCFQSYRNRPAKQLRTTKERATQRKVLFSKLTKSSCEAASNHKRMRHTTAGVFKAVEIVPRSSFKPQKNAPHCSSSCFQSCRNRPAKQLQTTKERAAPRQDLFSKLSKSSRQAA